MTIGTLYRMFNNLNNLTYVKVNEIKESETQSYPVNVVVFSDRFMNMPLSVNIPLLIRPKQQPTKCNGDTRIVSVMS